MEKRTLRRITAVAVAAACMVQFPVSADEIIEEDMAVEEAVVAEETVPEAELIGVEIAEVASVPAEVAEAAQQQVVEDQADVIEAADAADTESEEETEAREFFFENEEVVVTAQAELPEEAQLQVRKLEEGSEEYEAAKSIAADSFDASEEAQYSFYDVTFTVDGVEAEPEEGTAMIQVQFKTIQMGTADTQHVLRIHEDGADDVTAETEAGCNMSSVNFAI